MASPPARAAVPRGRPASRGLPPRGCGLRRRRPPGAPDRLAPRPEASTDRCRTSPRPPWHGEKAGPAQARTTTPPNDRTPTSAPAEALLRPAPPHLFCELRRAPPTSACGGRCRRRSAAACACALGGRPRWGRGQPIRVPPETCARPATPGGGPVLPRCLLSSVRRYASTSVLALEQRASCCSPGRLRGTGKGVAGLPRKGSPGLWSGSDGSETPSGVQPVLKSQPSPLPAAHRSRAFLVYKMDYQATEN